MAEFISIPIRVLYAKINIEELRFYLDLLKLVDDKGKISLVNWTITEFTGYNTRKIQRILARLKKEGLIKVAMINNQYRTIYPQYVLGKILNNIGDL